MAKEFIKIGGAREHNLKNLTLSIPRDKLVVITGLSGSGKSSLAFDTIYAEGQRKYVESLSAYARQFLDQMQKPDADYIEGLSPAIAIEQRSSGANPRSTIATTTEIYDYLRLLYAHVGQPHCPVSGEPITHQTTSDIVDQILSLPPKTRVMLLAPVVTNQKGEFRDVIERLAREGFVRARVDGVLLELAANVRVQLDPKQKHIIEVVVDRLVIDDKVRIRLSDSVETALKWGGGRLLLLHQSPGLEPATWNETLYSNRLYSPATGQSFDWLTPKHFSFNSPFGACPVCHGLGQKMVLDAGLIVPDPEKSLEQGAVLPWRRGGKRMVAYYKSMLRAVAQHSGHGLEESYKSLPDEFQRVLLRGSGVEGIEFHFWRAGKMSKVKRPFEGVIPNLERLYQESESEFTKNRLKAFMSPQPCDACNGKRLKPEILAVTLGDAALASQFKGQSAHSKTSTPFPGLSIMDLCALSIAGADEFFAGLNLTDFQQKIAGDVIKEIRSRLRFLCNVGLDYLTLDRESGTLSGGEAQRIRLATQIGAGLVGVLYILDEPSIGLHQRDNQKLLKTLQGLRDLGNSVLVVEHDEETIRRADYIIDLGPGAGIHGGSVVARGSPAEVMANEDSLTGQYLRGDMHITLPHRARQAGRYLTVAGAREHNLKNVTVRVPLGLLTCVTGVSGSGKSTLLFDVLYRSLRELLYGEKERGVPQRPWIAGCSDIKGIEHIDKIVNIDQSPIGRTPRSNPATDTGLITHHPAVLANLPESRVRGYRSGRYSFNVKGGRCEACQGGGLIKIEMHFLPDVYVTCEVCKGRRYNRETLEVRHKEKSIADVLDMTVEEALAFFQHLPLIKGKLQTLFDVGLGYIKLGQSATTLSGGEAQRVKLSRELSKRATGRTLYILDEPTTGLHFADIQKLLEVLNRLVESGNTVVVIEHNLDVVRNADWIIDLGPEGGDRGGEVVVAGTPKEVAGVKASHTGRVLRGV